MKVINVPNIELLSVITEFLHDNKDVEIKVKGNSMIPFFKHNKTDVRIRKVKVYKKYDVVLASLNNKVILHRIIKINNSEAILMGDGLLTKEIVPLNNIYGKVISFKTNNKIIKNYNLKVKIWVLLRPIRRILLKFIKKEKQWLLIPFLKQLN